MPAEQPSDGYRAYLLRLWRSPGGWRASLVDPHTNQQQAFAGLEALFAYLSRATRDPPDGEKPGADQAAGPVEPGPPASLAS